MNLFSGSSVVIYFIMTFLIKDDNYKCISSPRNACLHTSQGSNMVKLNFNPIPILNKENILLGVKKFGSHLIQPYGKVLIKQENSSLRITGSQTDGISRVIMDGIITIIDDRNFTFKGDIEVYDSILMNSDTFIFEDQKLSGIYTFRRIGDRKYWRLKQPNTTTGFFKNKYHYIDIFM